MALCRYAHQPCIWCRPSDCYFKNCLFSLFAWQANIQNWQACCVTKCSSYLYPTVTVSGGQSCSVLCSMLCEHTPNSLSAAHMVLPCSLWHCLTLDITSGTFCTSEGAEGNRNYITNDSQLTPPSYSKFADVRQWGQCVRVKASTVVINYSGWA